MMSEDTKGTISQLVNSINKLNDSFSIVKDSLTDSINELKTKQTVMQVTLESVFRETKKTNGTVRKHTDQIQALEIKHAECPVRQLEKDISRLEKTDEKLEKKDDLLNDKTFNAQWTQRNPGLAKMMYIGVGATVVVFLFGLFKTLQTLGIL